MNKLVVASSVDLEETIKYYIENFEKFKFRDSLLPSSANFVYKYNEVVMSMQQKDKNDDWGVTAWMHKTQAA